MRKCDGFRHETTIYREAMCSHLFIFIYIYFFRTNNLYSDCIPIKDIRPNLKNINVVFIILEVGAATVTKENRVVRTFKVGDPTAVINVSVWDEPGNLLVPGDIVRLTKGYAAIWRHCLTLYSGKNGDIHKVGEFCMNFNEHVNMSEPNPSLTGSLPLQPLQQQQQSIVVNPLAQKNPTSTVTTASVIINNNGTTSANNNINNNNNNNGNSIASVSLPPTATTVIAPVPIVVTATTSTSNAIPPVVAQQPPASVTKASGRTSATSAAAAAAAVATTSEHSKTSTSKANVRGVRNSRR